MQVMLQKNLRVSCMRYVLTRSYCDADEQAPCFGTVNKMNLCTLHDVSIAAAVNILNKYIKTSSYEFFITIACCGWCEVTRQCWLLQSTLVLAWKITRYTVLFEREDEIPVSFTDWHDGQTVASTQQWQFG